VDFQLLHGRLVSHVRSRVRNGEISERGLARLTGISQPHIHNVLKGVRLLSADMADRILRRLRIDLADLLNAEAGAAGWEAADSSVFRAVALLEGCIGREHPYPRAAGRERYPFPAADVDRLQSPVAARLAPDAWRAPLFSGHGVVLLDRSETARREPDEEGYFALDLSGGGAIGLVRRARRHLYFKAVATDAWQSLPLLGRAPLDAIQGRVRLVVRQL
jgi:plasmid maintenance system antidote protein VapI